MKVSVIGEQRCSHVVLDVHTFSLSLIYYYIYTHNITSSLVSITTHALMIQRGKDFNFYEPALFCMV